MDSATLNYLQGYLPDPLLALLREHVLAADAPLPLWTAAVADQLGRAADALRPLAAPYAASATKSFSELSDTMLHPLLDRVTRAAYNAPDVVVLLFVLVLVFLLWQVLSLVRRLVAWWTRLALRLLFWAGVVLAAAVVWQRGLAQSAQDAAAILGKLLGYAAFVRDIWQAEYRRYQQQQVQAQAAVHNNHHHGGGGGGGYQYQQARGGWSSR